MPAGYYVVGLTALHVISSSLFITFNLMYGLSYFLSYCSQPCILSRVISLFVSLKTVLNSVRYVSVTRTMSVSGSVSSNLHTSESLKYATLQMTPPYTHVASL